MRGGLAVAECLDPAAGRGGADPVLDTLRTSPRREGSGDEPRAHEGGGFRRVSRTAIRPAELAAQRDESVEVWRSYVAAGAKGLTDVEAAGLLREADRLAGCRWHLRVSESGELERQVERCGSQWCAYCRHHDNAKRAAHLHRVSVLGWQAADRAKRAAGAPPREARLVLVTLTLPGGEWRRSAQAGLERLSKARGRMMNRAWWDRMRKAGAGGVWTVEVGVRKRGAFNPHLHVAMTLPPGVGVERLKRELKLEWRKAGGGYVRVQAVTLTEASEGGLGAELAKYLAKPLEAGPERLAKVMHAGRNRRRFTFFGTWTELRQPAREAEVIAEASAEPEPEPEQAIDPATGEVAELEPGRHSLTDLGLRAKAGDRAAARGLEWSAWDAREGGRRAAQKRCSELHSEALERGGSVIALVRLLVASEGRSGLPPDSG